MVLLVLYPESWRPGGGPPAEAVVVEGGLLHKPPQEGAQETYPSPFPFGTTELLLVLAMR